MKNRAIGNAVTQSQRYSLTTDIANKTFRHVRNSDHDLTDALSEIEKSNNTRLREIAKKLRFAKQVLSDAGASLQEVSRK